MPPGHHTDCGLSIFVGMIIAEFKVAPIRSALCFL